MKALLTCLMALFFCPLTLASSKSLKCRQVFTAVDHMTEAFQGYQGQSLTQVRKRAGGQWLEVSRDQWVRYQIFGDKGPVRIHLEGLGGQIERSLESQTLAEHSKTGRVLVVELEGQGLREVHHRLFLSQSGRNPRRVIEFHDNIASLKQALELIFRKHRIKEEDIVAWSGHSFGGLSLAGLMTKSSSHPPLLQFLATGVANHNHRLLSEKQNAQIRLLGNMMNLVFPQSSRLAIESAVEQMDQNPLFAAFRSDPIKAESAVALTLGADSIDGVKFASRFPEGSRVQIFSAENDQVVFNMLHWELAEASREAGHPTQLIMVEGVGHFLPAELSRAQVRAKQRLTNNPHRFNEPYYLLKKDGDLTSLTESQAFLLYSESTYRTWTLQKHHLEDLFRNFAATPQFPEHWKHPDL